MNFQKFIKGASAVARKNELIVDQLAYTKAAENARKIRTTQAKRVIQKEGVIRVKYCRKMTSERMKEENRLETTRQNKLTLNQR
jgi:DNA-directed RNA polymerase subunit E'/Rpb7